VEPCINDVVQIASSEGAIFMGKDMPGHARRHSAVSCAKWMNRLRCCLGCGLGWSKEACIRLGAHWRHLANTNELFMCGGGAAFLSNYFDPCYLLLRSKIHSGYCSVKAKFHYAIQVADLVADLAFDKLVRVCDQLTTFWVEGRSQVSTCRDSSNLPATGRKPGLRPGLRLGVG